MRNPFRIKASQRAENDEHFVRLFGARALGLFDDISNPFGGLVVLRSAPGGGKTSFLRLMTPRPLRLVYEGSPSSPTYIALKKKDAISDEGPTLLGVLATFRPEYRDLDDIDRGLGMFRSLLNSRIVVATMRAVLESSNLTYPNDLHKVEAQWSPDVDVTIPAQATGKELCDWAKNIEQKFYEGLDDLGDGGISSGHIRLDALTWFSTAKLKNAYGEIQAKRLLMFDDLQWLSDNQRKSLMYTLTNERTNCGIWVAERMEALNYQEILSEGVLQNRDYEGVLKLENQWSTSHKAYSKFVSQVARLRADQAEGFGGHDFLSLLEDDDTHSLTSIWKTASEKIKMRVEKRISEKQQERNWINTTLSSHSSDYEKAVHWRATEILVERGLAKNQPLLDLTSDEDSSLKYNSGVRNAAVHFLREEFKAPIYFGKNMLAMASSWNIYQYIEVAGDIFEEISAKVTGPRAKPNNLTTNRQHAIIKNAAKKRWHGIPRRLPMGYEARRLLEAAGIFCRYQTFHPRAPYAPGVTGFGITMEDRARLIDRVDSEPIYYPKLRQVLASLVAHNEVTPRLDHRNKGREYVVFYLNRLVCVYFDLPLGFGGWREKSLGELSQWLEKGAAAVKEDYLVE